MLALKVNHWVCLLLASLLTAPAFAAGPDILTLPRLAPGLAPGTLAWATPDQLHPTQPQTGKSEVKGRKKKYLKLLPKADDEFPEDLYQYFLSHETIVPVYLGPVFKSDSRFGAAPALGYPTDRTHRANAISRTIREKWGDKALSEAYFDKNGRPLNFILVRVIEDQSKMSESKFVSFMNANQHDYLRDFVRQPDGTTVIRKILFQDLPEKIYETSNNPFRDIVRAAQEEGLIPRIQSNFVQFLMAEALVKNHVTTWDEILETPEIAMQKAAIYMKSNWKTFLHDAHIHNAKSDSCQQALSR